jgi:hypothetical protein
MSPELRVGLEQVYPERGTESFKIERLLEGPESMPSGGVHGSPRAAEGNTEGRGIPSQESHCAGNIQLENGPEVNGRTRRDCCEWSSSRGPACGSQACQASLSFKRLPPEQYLSRPLSCLTVGFPITWWASSSPRACGSITSSKMANPSRRSFDPTTATSWAHAKPDDFGSREKDRSVWFRLNRQSFRK